MQAAILGSGNVGADLVHKLAKDPGRLELVLVSGIDPESEGLSTARGLGIRTSLRGVDAIVEDPEIEIVFDATTARAHRRHAGLLEKAGKIAVDLTPSLAGALVVPVVNLTRHLDGRNLNLLTCAAQATVPVVYALSTLTRILYAEAVSTLAGVSAGPGMRDNIDEFITATARGLERIGGARHGKTIIILSPADPPITMRNVVHIVPEEGFDDAEAAACIRGMVAEMEGRVPGYRLQSEPVFEERETPWGRKRIVTAVVEVEGAGDYLPGYAGNLDIMTTAAREAGELLARRLEGARERPA